MTTPRTPTARLLRDHESCQRPMLVRAAIAAVAAALAAVGLLALSGWFLTASAIYGAMGPAAVMTFNYLVPSACIRLLAIIRTIGRYGERIFSHQAALQALAGLRTELFGLLAGVDPRRMHGFAAADTTARLTSDLDALEDHIIRLPARPAALAAATAAILLTAMAGVIAAVILLLGFALLVPAAARLARLHVDAPAARAATALGRLKAEYAAQSAAAADIAVYGLAGRATASLSALAAEYDDFRRQVARGEAWLTGLLVASGPVFAALVLLTTTANAPRAALGALAAAAAVESFAAWVRARAREAAVTTSLDRLDALLPTDVAPAPASPPGAVTAVIGIGPRQFAAGSRFAITGPTGSGKTRLLETLAGLRDDAPQTVLLDGQPVVTLPFEQISPTFALAPQDPLLIAGTISDNLRLARPGVDDSDMWAALETACLADDVRRLPQGLQSWIGEGGARLSGGQRKRLALARALLAERPWLLLDEPSEGLDAATEARLVQRLGGWLRETGTGLVLVSHRPAMHSLTSEDIAL